MRRSLSLLFLVACVLIFAATFISFFDIQPRGQACHRERSLLVAANRTLAPGKGDDRLQSHELYSVGKSNIESESDSPRGYIIATSYWEQQTQGMRSFLQLQCLGHSAGLKVVEPVIHRSGLSVPLGKITEGEHLLSLRDLIDMELWNKQTKEKYGYNPVVKWGTFLDSAPRDLILPCIVYRNPNTLRAPEPGAAWNTDCPQQCYNSLGNTTAPFMRKYQFQTVYKPCFNFANFANSVLEDTFISNLLGNWRRDNPNVTVLLREFRGFSGLYRLPVLSQCGVTHFRTDITILPSQRIMDESRAYLSEIAKGKTVIAILVRVERIVLHLYYKINDCAMELARKLHELHVIYPDAKHFLSMDVGKFGSGGARNLQTDGRVIFTSVFNDTWTFNEWESSLEKYVSNTNAAYVANFQRAVVAQSPVLVEVGGGGFQVLAEKYYKEFHPQKEDWSIHKVCFRRHPKPEQKT